MKVDTSALEEMLLLKIDDIIDYFKIDLQDCGETYSGKCPIHQGDRCDAFHLNKYGHQYAGKYICYTRHCENEFVSSILGFVRAMLSVKYKNWCAPGDIKVSFPQTINWCKKLLKIETLAEINEKELERRRFIRENGCNPPKENLNILTRNDVIKHLDIPSKYFISRGFSEKILKRYDIGDYLYKNKYLSDRAVVPIYNKDKTVAGFTARSVFDSCDKCNRYHKKDSKCPKTSDRLVFNKSAKWINKDFNKTDHIFNFYESITELKKTKTAILCEGVGDILRLEENNIQCALGLFGNSLTQKQALLLDSIGILKVILLLDNDNGGKSGIDEIIKKYRRYYNIVVPNININGKDIGDGKINFNDLKNRLYNE